MEIDAEGGGKERRMPLYELIVTAVGSKILTWTTRFDLTHVGMKQSLTPEKNMTCPHYGCVMSGLTCLIGIFCGEMKPAKSDFL